MSYISFYKKEGGGGGGVGMGCGGEGKEVHEWLCASHV